MFVLRFLYAFTEKYLVQLYKFETYITIFLDFYRQMNDAYQIIKINSYMVNVKSNLKYLHFVLLLWYY